MSVVLCFRPPSVSFPFSITYFVFFTDLLYFLSLDALDALAAIFSEIEFFIFRLIFSMVDSRLNTARGIEEVHKGATLATTAFLTGKELILSYELSLLFLY